MGRPRHREPSRKTRSVNFLLLSAAASCLSSSSKDQQFVTRKIFLEVTQNEKKEEAKSAMT